jgi:hypothetical protein
MVRVMVSVLFFPAVDHRFKPQSGQIKTIDLVFAASPLSTLLEGMKGKIGWLGIKIMKMCLSGATYLSMNRCFIEQAQKRTKQTSSSSIH